jgi:hypothetical protein
MFSQELRLHFFSKNISISLRISNIWTQLASNFIHMKELFPDLFWSECFYFPKLWKTIRFSAVSYSCDFDSWFSYIDWKHIFYILSRTRMSIVSLFSVLMSEFLDDFRALSTILISFLNELTDYTDQLTNRFSIVNIVTFIWNQKILLQMVDHAIRIVLFIVPLFPSYFHCFLISSALENERLNSFIQLFLLNFIPSL